MPPAKGRRLKAPSAPSAQPEPPPVFVDTDTAGQVFRAVRAALPAVADFASLFPFTSDGTRTGIFKADNVKPLKLAISKLLKRLDAERLAPAASDQWKNPEAIIRRNMPADEMPAAELAYSFARVCRSLGELRQMLGKAAAAVKADVQKGELDALTDPDLWVRAHWHYQSLKEACDALEIVLDAHSPQRVRKERGPAAAEFTKEQVKVIEAWRSGQHRGHGYKALAEQFGMTYQAVKKLIRRDNERRRRAR